MRHCVALVAAGQAVPAEWADLPTELHLRTCSMLKLDELVRLSQTSKYHHSLQSEVYHHRLRVLLTSKFNLPFTGLNSQLRRQKAIIVGALPTAIVDPELPEPYEIDICVPSGGTKEFGQFILARTSYRHVEHHMTPLYPTTSDSGILQIITFRCTWTQRILRIMETELKTATTAVFLLPTTSAMTYVTWNTIVCPYPRMHMNRVGILNTHRTVIPTVTRRFVTKFKSIGFGMHPDAAGAFPGGHLCGSDPNCAQTPRRIGDGGCMVIKWNGNRNPLDLIDSKLEWRLACCYRCTGFKQPTGASVTSGAGESIEIRVNRGTFEAMTVIRLKDGI